MEKQMNTKSGKRQVTAAAALLCLFFMWAVPGGALGQTTVPVMVDYFDTGGFGSPDPDGITYISEGTYAGHYAIVDARNTNKVFIADRAGIVKKEIDISGFSTFATGITFIPDSSHLAITDNSAREVFIIDFDGNIQTQFDTALFSPNPQGIVYINTATFSDIFAIVDQQNDTVHLRNRDGTSIGGFPTIGFSTTPTGISFLPSLEYFVILDNTTGRRVSIVEVAGFAINVKDQFTPEFVTNNNHGITWDPMEGTFVIASHQHAEVFSFDAEGSAVDPIPLAPTGATTPNGITYMPGIGNYAIVDNNLDDVFIIEPDGSKVSQCDIGTFSSSASGIAYIPDTGNLAIADFSEREVFIIDTGCILLDQFDIATYGIQILTPSGIVAVPGGLSAQGQFQILDNSRDDVKRVDPARPGRIRSQFSPGAFNITNPQGITQIDISGNLVIVQDSNPDNAYIMNPQGALLGIFPVDPFSTPQVIAPQGIAFNSDDSQIAVIDATNNTITIFELPSLIDLPGSSSCQGDFNDDGDVDGEDLDVFASEYGQTCQ